MVVLPIEHGFASPDVVLLSEQDILGDRLVRRRKSKKSADAFLAEMQAMQVGDYVVHIEHGIGRYEGLMSIAVGRSPHDCVALTYAGGDKLYVPVENIDVLSRYGSHDGTVTLDKLGGEAWQRRKSKLKERITRIAHELIRTAAERALRPGVTMELEPAPYAAFVDRFPYAETEDQERVITEVLDDLASGTPMDRLVCGDVGFGKTEVAMRAAFAAAMAGYQVAVIAPTTLLARQHSTNFIERFADTPLKVGRLSRLVPTAEAAKTRDGLTDGTVDIIIGTHAVLAKSIKFKRLGLVIVDEEQRFGVNHKEQLKALKTDVHMLTLTATPIPRTLQMAMSWPARIVGDPDPAGRPSRGAHLRDAVGPRRVARSFAARTLSWRAKLFRRAAHLRFGRDRGFPARSGSRGKVRRRTRPNGCGRNRRADECVLRQTL